MEGLDAHLYQPTHGGGPLVLNLLVPRVDSQLLAVDDELDVLVVDIRELELEGQTLADLLRPDRAVVRSD